MHTRAFATSILGRRWLRDGAGWTEVLLDDLFLLGLGWALPQRLERTGEGRHHAGGVLHGQEERLIEAVVK